jgi:hypothetical protein
MARKLRVQGGDINADAHVHALLFECQENIMPSAFLPKNFSQKSSKKTGKPPFSITYIYRGPCNTAHGTQAAQYENSRHNETSRTEGSHPAIPAPPPLAAIDPRQTLDYGPVFRLWTFDFELVDSPPALDCGLWAS